MNAVTARILIDAFAINAEVEGMKAQNAYCAFKEMDPQYVESDFHRKASALGHLANGLYDAWQQGQAE
jgi:hypothetical protein